MSRGARRTVLTAVWVGLWMGLCGGARAAELPGGERPMLVVVETGPGAGCDGSAVRAAIEAELKARVVAPASPPVVALAGPRSDILLVAVDRGRIVVTLRGRGDRELTRSIPAPVDRAARLRAVAWLAGNVARDQLSTLTLPAAPSASASRAEAAAEPADEAAADATLPAAPATEPPPEVVPPTPDSREALASGAATIVRLAPQVAASAAPRWTLGADVGLAAVFQGPFTNVSYETAYREIFQVEAQRHLRAPFFVGAALDLGPNVMHQWGLAGLAGVERRSNDLFLSVSLGAGVNVVHTSYDLWVPDQAAGNGTVHFAGRASDTDAMFYGRVAIEFGLALSRTLDLVARLNGHLSVTEKYNPIASHVGTSLGLRMRFY